MYGLVCNAVDKQGSLLSTHQRAWLLQRLIAPCTWAVDEVSEIFALYPSYKEFEAAKSDIESSGSMFIKFINLNSNVLSDGTISTIHAEVAPFIVDAVLHASGISHVVRKRLIKHPFAYLHDYGTV
jgi:hypothetical protein